MVIFYSAWRRSRPGFDVMTGLWKQTGIDDAVSQADESHKLMLFLTFSLFSLQMRVRAGGRTVAGVGSVWSGKERAVPSVCARKAATLRLCPCVALTDVFMRTTASCTAPLACSGGEYIWSTAKTAFSKVRCMFLYVALQTRVSYVLMTVHLLLLQRLRFFLKRCSESSST